ncbi:MAG: tetratricopeptide repeat protein [Muribaculaceae bacterium]|nr:tetratricopeptide repeat protein [Muribaculaceae bacterium]
MNCKKLLVTSMLLTVSILCVNPSFAAEPIKAQVSKSYVDIDKMIEYNNYETADQKLKEILTKNPNDLDAKALQLISQAKQYKLAPAQSELDKLLKKYPNKPEFHYAQGLVYLMRETSSDVEYIKNIKNLSEAAIQEFVTAVGLDSTYYQAFNAMGVATLKLGNKQDAQELFQTALKNNPNFAPAYDNLGNVAMLDGDLDQAEKYYLQSLKCNSHNPTSMYHMGQVEARRGDYTKALTWLNHSLHINPNSSSGWNLQGELYLKQGNQPAAINSFKKAIRVKPENSKPYINLAGVYERRSDHEFAMEELKTAIILNPNYKEGIYRVANMSLVTKKYPQALEYYSRLLGDATYNNNAIIGLANTYYEMSKDTADSRDFTTNKDVYLAYDYVNEAIQRTPNDLKLHLAKIKLGKLTHQMELTQDNLNYIIQSASDSLMDTVIKGEAYLSMGRERDAVYTFENAINFANSVDDELYLAEILVQHKQFRTARKALQKVLMAESDNRIAENGLHYIDLCEMKSNEFFEIALRQFKEGNYASTIEYCNRAIDFYHNAPSIAKLKAQAYEAEGNYAGAIKYYTQYLALSPNATDKAAVVQRIQVFQQKI